MVVNLCNGANNNNNLTNQLLLDSQELLHSNTTQSQLREQLRTIQNHHLQQQEQAQALSGHQSNFGSFEAAPSNQYTQAQPSPSSASILLAAQLLFGSGNSQSENTPPHLAPNLNHNLFSPTQLMDTSQPNQNTSSANSADAGSPSSSHSNDMNGGDAEGVWSADIDQAFHEALQIYPPCGRRKIILSEEGKMYGRNELIARYIKIRCGKTRTRKQVSSHIQVLARKKNREVQSKLKTQEVKSEEDFPHGSNFGSPKSADSLVAAISAAAQQQISPINNVSSQFQNHTASIPTSAKIKVESLSKAVSAATQPSSIATSAQLPTAATLQWPYNMVPQMFNNNNFYGNVVAGINNDENIYANFAAALSANAFVGAGQTVASNGNAASTNPLLLGGLPATLGKILPFSTPTVTSANPSLFRIAPQNDSASLASHTVASSKLTLCGFTAYVEREGERVDIVKIPAVIDELETIRFDSIKSKFPELLEQLFHQGPSDAFFLVKCWANVSFDIGAEEDQSNALYAVDSFYDSLHNFDISISSKVCSFGKQVVEKVEIYSANDDPNDTQSTSVSNPPAPYHYRLDKSPMCDYMVAFIRELKKLETSEMNCVLENFTILQIIQNKHTDETLMVIAFNFEVSPEPESNCRVFRLV